ncbi:MAG: alpha/beta fold hydrolase, partial [Bacteroidales bacterium]|nr:alpha/beta fold hydrolase [Bacteroidales bacterium]
MAKKTRKIIWITIGTLVVIIIAALIGVGFYMVNYSLGVDENRYEKSVLENNQLFRHFPESQEFAIGLREEGILKDTTIIVNGLKRHAYYAASEVADGKTAVIVHGYRDNALTFMFLAKIYRENLGCNVILPDLYGHGHSDGDAIRMGWLDRLDVLDWCEWSKNFFGGNTRIVIHGVSMGAATTMCVAGENTPDYIKCFVEDCGYTSVWDEFAKELKVRFGLPTFPILDVSGL